MSSIALLVVGLAAFATGYQFYSRYIAKRIYQLDPDFKTPAHSFEDGVDFMPTNRHVLFGTTSPRSPARRRSWDPPSR